MLFTTNIVEFLLLLQLQKHNIVQMTLQFCLFICLIIYSINLIFASNQITIHQPNCRIIEFKFKKNKNRVENKPNDGFP